MSSNKGHTARAAYHTKEGLKMQQSAKDPMKAPLRIVFMGTPDFAARVLRLVAAWPGGKVLAAYSQPDRPAGRGHKLHAPEVKSVALSLGIPVFQPLHFKDEAQRAALADLAPDVLVVAAYGLILPQSVLDIPRLGPFNVHASLLPRHRGAAPIQRAIMEGDSISGISIMRMERGLDTGPVAAQRALGIGLDDTAGSLTDELADLGGRLMVEELERLAAGTPSTLIPQDDSRASYAAKLGKEDGRIVWNRPAQAVHAAIRGVTPSPGARAVFLAPGREPLPVLLSPGKPQTMGTAETTGMTGTMGTPGTTETPALLGAAKCKEAMPPSGTLLGLREDCLAVACADATYLIHELKPAGGRTMSASAFWNGYCRSAEPASLHFVQSETAETPGGSPDTK